MAEILKYSTLRMKFTGSLSVLCADISKKFLIFFKNQFQLSSIKFNSTKNNTVLTERNFSVGFCSQASVFQVTDGVCLCATQNVYHQTLNFTKNCEIKWVL